jgi:multidrug resistance protein MdtO
MIIQTALASVAFFWNQFAVLHSPQARDFLTQPELSEMRHHMAVGLEAMAASVVHKTTLVDHEPAETLAPSLFASPRYGEYARNSVDRFRELQSLIADLETRA